MKHEHDKAVAALREAVRVQPNDAAAYAVLGFYLHWAGNAEEAIGALKTAQRLGPKPTKSAAHRNAGFLGFAYFTAGRYDDAIASINKHYARSVRVGSDRLPFLAAAYIATGQDEKARAVMKAFLNKKPNTTLSNYKFPRLYKQKEDQERLLNLLRKAGMPE